MKSVQEPVKIDTFSHEQPYWAPSEFHDDPKVNAVLNVAAQISVLASATSELLYGLKYGKDTGMSIAEAIEVAAKNAAETVAVAITNSAEER